jgi:hypothetical protein
MIRTGLKKASDRREKQSSNRLELLKRVAERGDAAGIARILASDNNKKKKTIVRRGPKTSAAKQLVPPIIKPVRKPTKPKPARKPVKPARRCATS